MRVIERFEGLVRTRGEDGEARWRKTKRGTRIPWVCSVCSKEIPVGSLAYKPVVRLHQNKRVCKECGEGNR